MATINEVADRAGVSTATVSRALNGKNTVGSELATRVLVAAEELEYRPNGPARNLRRQETPVLALIISDVENPFFTAISRGVEDVAHTAGYSVVLCNSDDDVEKESSYVSVALEERVAGLLLSPTGHTSSGELLSGTGTPFVALDRSLPDISGDTVLVDTGSAARKATKHLSEQGYRRPGCITGPAGVPTADERLAGYRDGLRAAGIRDCSSLVRRSEFKATGAGRAARSLLESTRPPDALLVANNAMALGVLETLRDLGLRAGSDVGVVAFDDAPWARLLDPPLSVVAQPAYDIGTVGAQLLLSRIGNERGEPTTTTLSAHLVPRASSTPR